MEFLTGASPALYVVVAVAGTLLFLPGSVTMTLAGFLFGFWPGILYAVVAITLGAQLAFLCGRRVVRPWVEKRLQRDERLRAYEAGLQQEGFVIVALSRLSLVIPFNVFNHVCGASSVRAATYFAATALGMVPPLLLYTYLGTLTRDIEQVLSGASTPGELNWWLFGFGIAVLALLIYVVRRAARRALSRHLDVSEDASSAY